MKKKKIKLVDAVTDPWMRRFINGMCDFFGVPATSVECHGINDRLMFSWAMLNMAKVVNEYPDLLYSLRIYEPDEAVEIFARTIYEKTGKLTIPAIPLQTGSAVLHDHP